MRFGFRDMAVSALTDRFEHTVIQKLRPGEIESNYDLADDK
jgi:hypothetical protein